MVAFLTGGDEGCRTPVRKSKNRTFYECSFVIKISSGLVYKQTWPLVASFIPFLRQSLLRLVFPLIGALSQAADIPGRT